VVQSSDLGLPGIAGLLGNAAGGSGNLTSLIAGSNTARVWYAGEEKMRFSLLGTSNQTDVIRNGTDVWIWESAENTGTHVKLPASAPHAEATPSGLPSTPQEAADAALAAIGDTTKVETTGAGEVAGRDAYELVISPRDTSSLVGQVRLAIDAKEHIPLRVDVFAKNTTKPAFRVAFEQITFAVPADEQFTFNPPAGAKMTEETVPADALKGSAGEAEKPGRAVQESAPEAGSEDMKVLGKGWTSIVVAKAQLPKAGEIPAPKAGEEAAPEQMQAMLDKLLGTLQPVSGSWGSGRLLSGALFTVLLTDDGRVLAGAVTPEALYAAAAQK
jgi:outer membrane lipoprotein-sorting protein